MRTIGILICVAALASACSKPAMEQAETTAAVPVQAEEAKVDTLRATINVSGTVSPAPDARERGRRIEHILAVVEI